ncbi:unnamed protein product [Symbiodinium pilosum]|uniref:Uncharacterized protein n=1 Tax=Symbiodinium pilosum TaxID=2952 RepID=A0A812IYZ9_SYMPI|nr:unnamed protein product [Symbiodinium pilosum]
MTAGPLLAADEWCDWQPVEQTALDFLLAEKQDESRADDSADDDEEDEWNPVMQSGAGYPNADDVPTCPVGGDTAATVDNEADEDSDSDDDWAPQSQGAANVEKSEQEALKVLLQPNYVKDTRPEMLETKKEADAAGRMLHQLQRPPTWEEVKSELPRGPDVDPDLLEAPTYKDMTQEEAIDLVNRGANVNFHGQHGRMPLHKASEKAFPHLIKTLCEARADPDGRDQFGETALHVLAKSGSWDDSIPKSRRCEAIQMLLQHGADVHAVNPRGRGVLHLAVTEHDAPAIETLIEGMADVNAQDLAGFTPLMWAAGRDGADCVKMLLDCEADMNVKAARGQTAMTFALTNGCNAIVDMLEKHQAILDAEEAKRIKERGEGRSEDVQEDWGEELQLPRPDWACKHEKPEALQAYAGRVYAEARPDRHSNVYVDAKPRS